MPLERKVPIEYHNGVYDPSGVDRPNVMIISNLTFEGLTGLGSERRTALFTFYGKKPHYFQLSNFEHVNIFCDLAGQQVVEEILDAQRAGCPPEYFNMRIPLCHPLYDRDCRGDREIPFLRTRYDFGTGYNPNNPRQQVAL